MLVVGEGFQVKMQFICAQRLLFSLANCLGFWQLAIAQVAGFYNAIAVTNGNSHGIRFFTNYSVFFLT